jgi:glyoxylase-like metal-dependent hydrolase (beta-lactamase superfamily II)
MPLLHEHFAVGLFQMNCQVLADAGTRRALVIDPGDELPRILDCLQRHSLTLAQVVFTHAHIDHVGVAAPLLKLHPVPVAMHADDEPLYSHLAQQAQWTGSPVPERVKIDRYLSEGDVIELDSLRLEVLHTPGHSPGSVSLYLAEHGRVIAGDALFNGSIGRTDLPGGHLPTLLEAIRSRLFTLPEETVVYPGHGPTTIIGNEKRTNPFLTGR